MPEFIPTYLEPTDAGAGSTKPVLIFHNSNTEEEQAQNAVGEIKSALCDLGLDENASAS